MNQFYQLWMIQIREFFREPAVIFWAFAFPAGLALVLGFAFQSPSSRHEKIGVVVVSEEKDADSIIRNLSGQIEAVLMTEGQAIQALRRGEIHTVIRVEGSESIKFQYDPASDEAVRQQAMARNILYEKAGVPVSISQEVLRVPGSRYVDYLIPGLIAMGVMNACLWGTGWSLIGLRMKMLLRRMAASPMNVDLFFLSLGAARLVLVMLESAFLVVFAYAVFQLLPIGSMAGFFLLLLAGVIAFTGLAIALGSRTANTQIGNGLINAAAMPMMLLSGVFFSYHGFPDVAQTMIRFLPLTILADGLRAIYLEGAGVRESLLPAAELAGFGIITLFVGKRLFRWS